MDFIKLLRQTLPATPRLRQVCAGLIVSMKSAPVEGAEAPHGEDCCVVCCVDFSILIPK
jgi:hypothetical protein